MAYSARYNQSTKTYAVFSDSGGFVNIDDVAKMLNERDELLATLKKIIVWLEGNDSTLGILDTTDGYYEWSIVTMDDRLKARAAIAKAEGEQ